MGRIYRVSPVAIEMREGRCEACDGVGVIAIHPVTNEPIPCSDCRGTGWRPEVLN